MKKNKTILIILFYILIHCFFNLNAAEIINIPDEFLTFAKEASNYEINEDNVINNLLYLELKITDKSIIKQTYNILGEILKRIKKDIKNNFTPKEKLIKIYDILKNDFKLNYNESSSDLFSKNLINKNIKCDTSSFIYLVISQELNWPIYCMLLPNHMFIRWSDNLNEFNFETTNSGIYKEEFYIKEYKISDSNIIRFSEKELIGYFYYKIGCVQYELNDYKDALINFNNAIELNKNCSNFYYNRGITKNKLKDYTSAIIDFDSAIELYNNDYNIYFGRGNAKYEINDLYGAIKDYDRVIELNNKFYEAFFNRGMIKSEIKDYSDAIDDFKKIIDINKNNFKIYFFLGNLYSEIKDYYSAIDNYTKALELNNKFLEGYYKRGIAKKEINYYYEAISDFDMAIGLDNTFADAYFEKGLLFYNLMKIEEAVNNFKKAVNINPDLMSIIPKEIKKKIK